MSVSVAVDSALLSSTPSCSTNKGSNEFLLANSSLEHLKEQLKRLNCIARVQ